MCYVLIRCISNWTGGQAYMIQGLRASPPPPLIPAMMWSPWASALPQRWYGQYDNMLLFYCSQAVPLLLFGLWTACRWEPPGMFKAGTRELLLGCSCCSSSSFSTCPNPHQKPQGSRGKYTNPPAIIPHATGRGEELGAKPLQ